MNAWGDIRLKARDCHREALRKANGDRNAAAILAAALELDDLQLQRYEPGTIVGDGVHGFLDRSSLMVYVANGQSAGDEAVVIAHEIGHFKLHRDPRNEVTAISPGLGGDPDCCTIIGRTGIVSSGGKEDAMQALPSNGRSEFNWHCAIFTISSGLICLNLRIAQSHYAWN